MSKNDGNINGFYFSVYLKKLQGVFAVFLVVSQLLFSFNPLPAEAASGVPSILSYQGRLADASGNLLGGSGTTYYFKFSLWNDSTVGGGTKVWPSSAPTATTATVKDGVFNVAIGDTANGYPDTLDYNFNTSRDLYLQIEVSSNGTTFETLSPRQRVSATSFARIAGSVSGVEQSSFGTTSPISGSVVSIEATTSAAQALTVRGAASQSANIFSVQDSLGSNLFAVTATGGLLASSTFQATGLATFYGGARFGTLTNCDSLDTDSQGNLVCGVDAGGVGNEVNLTFFNNSGVRMSTTTNQFLIGANSTTSAQKLEVIGGVYFSGNLGLGTTTPYAKLSVVGQAVAEYFTSTSTTRPQQPHLALFRI